MVNSVNSFNNSQLLQRDNVQDKIAKSKQLVSDNFESNSAVKTLSTATGGSDSMSKSVSLVPLLYFLDKIVDNRMGGSIEKSSLGKVASFGDKISEFFHLENIFSEEKVSKLSKFLKQNRFTKYFTNEYKAIPKSSLAQSQSLAEKYLRELNEQTQKLIPDFAAMKYNKEIMKQLESVLSPQTIKFIQDVGPLKNRLTGDYLASVSNTLTELTGVAEKHLGTVGVKDKELIVALKDNITKFLSGADDISEKALSEQIAELFVRFSDKAHKNLLKDKSVNLSKEALDVLATVSDKTFSKDQILAAVDDFAAKGIELSGSDKLSIARNKLSAADSKVGNTLLGKLFSKGFLKTKDIVTYGGGLISMFFMASAIYNSVKAAKEAPEGEKKATFMHVLSEQYLGMILFQPSISLMYKLGGNKYRGMTVEAREALKTLIKNTNADVNLTKDALKVAKIQRDLLIKGVDKDKVADLAGKSFEQAKIIAKSLKKEGAKLKFWEKPLKLMGSILSMGLDKMQKPKYINFPKLGLKKIPQPTLKGFIGGFGRFAIIMFIIQPLIQKPLTKLFHKIFGEPKTYLAKQNAENNNQANKASQNEQNKISDSTETNLIKKWTQPALPENNVINHNENNGIPSEISSTSLVNANPSDSQPLKPQKDDNIPALNIFKKEKTENKSRYIPSIEPVVIPDNSEEIQAKVDAILKSTDRVIEASKKYL